MAKLNLNFLERDKNRPSNNLVSILNTYGQTIVDYAKEYFTYSISTSEFYGEIDEISLYIMAREISYDYRVIKVSIINVKEVVVTFYTLVTDQYEEKTVDVSNGLDSYESVLNTFLNTQLFNEALKFLVKQIRLKRSYNEDIKGLIKIGEAKTIRLVTGQTMNAGFYKIDGNKVYFYTGKGLREMFKPNMTTTEKIKAKKLQEFSEEQLLRNQYLDYVLIEEIAEIK